MIWSRYNLNRNNNSRRTHSENNGWPRPRYSITRCWMWKLKERPSKEFRTARFNARIRLGTSHLVHWGGAHCFAHNEESISRTQTCLERHIQSCRSWVPDKISISRERLVYREGKSLTACRAGEVVCVSLSLHSGNHLFGPCVTIKQLTWPVPRRYQPPFSV